MVKHLERELCDLDHVPFAAHETRPARHAALRTGHVPVALARRGVGAGRRRAAAPGRRRADKPGQLVPEDVEVEVRERAAVRLPRRDQAGQRARRLGLDVAGRQALDVGASTGGFTDCLLQRGAAHVVAVDVAYGELDWRLRNDPRVTVIERRNARSLRPDELPYAPDLIVVDVSFISLAKVLPAVLACAAPSASTAWRWSSRSSRSAASRSARAAWCGTRGAPAARCWRSAAAASGLGAAVAGYASSGLPGPEGQPRDVRVACRAARRGGLGCRGARGGARRRGGRAVNPVRTATVFTHRRPTETGPAIDILVEMAPRRRRRAAVRRRGDAQARARARPRASSSTRRCARTSTSASRSAATARSSARCAPTRARAFPCSASTSARSASSPPSTATRRDRASGGRSPGEFEVLALPGDQRLRRRRGVAGDQRRLDAPPARQPGRGPRICGRRRRGRPGALRRPGGRHARPGRPATTSPTAAR